MEKERVIRWGLGLLVLVFGLAVFGRTVAPTVSFWDCGEFIATSACLGIPHPPGAPLYVLIGRIFTLLPLGDDIGYRVNLISAITSAFTGLVGYLIILKLFDLWWPSAAYGRFWKYVAAASGALTMLFSNTFWSSAVEAEVYGLSMLLMLLLIYLSLRWYERRRTELNLAAGQTSPAQEIGIHPDRYLILICFLAFLSIAVHMTVFMVLPLIMFFVVMSDSEKRKDWRIYTTGLILLPVVASIDLFLLFLIGWLLLCLTASVFNPQKGGWRLPLFLLFILLIWFLGVRFIITFDLSRKAFWVSQIIWLAINTTVLISDIYFNASQKIETRWRVPIYLCVAAILGFTSQLYIPIRSLQNPPIDENNPENWERFKGFLERKQYGSENMLERALDRRGKLENQFGRYPRMGFWGFFETQYGKGGWAFAPVFLIGLAGLVLPFRRDKKTALLLLAIALAGTIGLVFYMNFADGTRMDAYGEAGLEVRDRDYFWTPGFVVFSLAVGIGLGCLGMLLSSEEARRKLKPPVQQALAALVVLAAVAVPTLAVKANYVRNSREGNFLPYDYAYNLLDSCDRDALLFTNGDNDTFPLWALQEAYGFRRDVRNINLSLLNTDWYILQLKNHMGVPVSLADSQITMKDLPLPGMAQTFPRPEHPYFDRRRGVSHYLMPVQMDNKLLRVQDFMVEDIVIINDFKFPLFFSRTVPSSARVGLDANLETEAMVLRLLPERKENRFDVEGTEKLLWESFLFRNFNNPEVTLDDNDAGMMTVYPEIAMELYQHAIQKKDTAKALLHLERAVEKFPFYPRTVLLLYDHYQSSGKKEKAKEAVERSRRYLERAVRRSAENPVWWMFLSNCYQLEEKKEEAYRAIQTAWELDRAEDFVFRTYVQYCLADGRTDLLLKLAREWLENHSEDEFARQILSQFGGTPQLPQGLPSR